MEWVSAGNPDYLCLSRAFITNNDKLKLVECGFHSFEEHHTRIIYTIPSYVKRQHNSFFNVETEEYLFKVCSELTQCFCPEFHWDEYKGGSFAVIIWPNERVEDKNPNYIAIKPLTREMIDQAERNSQRYYRELGECQLREENGTALFTDKLRIMSHSVRETANLQVLNAAVKYDLFRRHFIYRQNFMILMCALKRRHIEIPVDILKIIYRHGP